MAYELTTLSLVKQHLRISGTTYDALLTQYITDATSEIEQACDRQFAARDYRLRISTRGERRIRVPHWPIQYVTRIAYGFANAVTVTYTGGIRASATVYRDPESADGGGLHLVSVASNGTATTTNLSFATYKSVSALVAQVNATSGWTAATVQNVPTGDLNPTGAESALGRLVTFTYPDRDLHTYRIDHQRGMIEFDYDTIGYWPGEHRRAFPRGLEQVLVEYRGGWEVIPSDLDLTCREFVQDLYYAGARDTSITGETLGEYSYKLGATREERAIAARARLANYTSERSLMASGN